MKKLFLIFFVMMLSPIASYSQSIDVFHKIDISKTQTLQNKFQTSVSSPEFFSINKAAVQSILTDGSKSIQVNIPLNGNNVSLKLDEYNILTPDAVITKMTASGQTSEKANIPFKCYKGIYNNDINSMVVLCFAENFVKGIMLTDNASYTLATMEGNTMSDECILYQNDKILIKNNFKCDTDELPVSEESKLALRQFNPNNIVTPVFLQANIAIDIDFATYNVFGGNTSLASAYVMSILSSASALYNRDVNVKLSIPSINIWTTADPYVGATSNPVLVAFRNYWNANFQGVPRTVTHLISRRSPGDQGGIAYLNGICNNTSSGFGYGYSNTTGAIGVLPLYSWDIMVVSHELGHNFGSNHTHNCGWPGGPIDSCYTTEGGCYTGPPIARPGTIMSYCHLTSAGIDLRLGFGPLPKALIRQNSENASCIAPAAEQLIMSFPKGGETFNSNSQQYIYWGTSSVANFNIDLSSNNGASWAPLATGIPAQQHYYVWTVPGVQTSTGYKLRLYDPVNPLFADTTRGSFTIKYLLSVISNIAPPTNTTVVTTRTDTSRVNFSWTSAGSLPAITYKLKIKKFGGATAFLTSENSGSSTNLSVRKSKLDSVAVSLGLTGDSVNCTWTATAYNSPDSTSSGPNIIVIKTNTVAINNISTLLPTATKLYGNYPNPFNPNTKIKFDIAKNVLVRVTVYDMTGREVSKLVNTRLNPGTYEVDFDGALTGSGTYFYRIEAGDFVETRKMILLK
ncbi:hypothetical protein BH10BAC5_BH10BAC5_28290 [soil metagenome]